jgi:hypothetical protein
MDDQDNDGRFPDESPVEVRYPRSKQEEQGDRERWPWLPGTIVEQCGPDERPHNRVSLSFPQCTHDRFTVWRLPPDRRSRDDGPCHRFGLSSP